jgi:hypothetical protein
MRNYGFLYYRCNKVKSRSIQCSAALYLLFDASSDNIKLLSGSEKLKLLIIGKSKNPCCFKNIKSLDVDYESNKKAWVTSEIYEKLLLKLDKLFAAQRRNILLFVDNYPAHPPAIQHGLKNIKLVHFPPNMTSILQPMDQGIIQNLKHYYRKRVVKKCLTDMEQNVPTNVTLLDAIRDLSKTWTLNVKEQTIVNCFRKAAFLKMIHKMWNIGMKMMFFHCLN